MESNKYICVIWGSTAFTEVELIWEFLSRQCKADGKDSEVVFFSGEML